MNEFAQYFADAVADNGWTPDIPRLETQDHWYVFIYNKRKGKSSAYFTHSNSEAMFSGIGWTNSPIYSILNIQSKNSDLYLASHGTDRILGEVWKLTTEDLLLLDCEEKHLMNTKRVLVPVRLGAKGTVDAWMYTASRKFLIDGGNRISKYTVSTYIGTERFIEVH